MREWQDPGVFFRRVVPLELLILFMSSFCINYNKIHISLETGNIYFSYCKKRLIVFLIIFVIIIKMLILYLISLVNVFGSFIKNESGGLQDNLASTLLHKSSQVHLMEDEGAEPETILEAALSNAEDVEDVEMDEIERVESLQLEDEGLGEDEDALEAALLRLEELEDDDLDDEVD